MTTNIVISEQAMEAAKQAVRAEFSIDEDCGEYSATAIWGTPDDVVRTILEAAAPHMNQS